MRKIAVALSKGGVGKTTTAVNLAAGLAMRGAQVLLIDGDTQGQVTQSLGVRPKAGLAELVMEEVKVDDALLEARPKLWVLAGGVKLGGVKSLISKKLMAAERTIMESLQVLDGRFDYAIVDCAPGYDVLTINLLFYAEQVLCPVSLEVLALRGLVEFAKSVESIKKYHPDLVLKYVLPTFYDRRVKKSDEILAQLQSYYGPGLCKPIRYNVRLSEAPGFGRTIYEYDAQSTGAQDYALLTERIAHEQT